MSTSFYDVVVIGDELAGAVAAALLARRGFRILLLTSPPVERDSLGPHHAPRSPVALTGLESPAMKRVVNELNLLQLLRRRTSANHPAFQLLLPDHRIDVGDDLGRELQRELPEDAAAVESWLGRAAEVSATLEALLAQDVTLPPDGFWDRRDLKRIATQLPVDGDGEAALALPPGPAGMLAALPSLFASDLYRPGAVAHARLADQHRRGTWHLDGGRDALRTLLHERVRTYSGEVRYDQRARGLVLKRGRVVGVGVGDRDESVGCGQVIAALGAAELLALLPEAPPRRLEESAAVRAALYRYRLHFVAPLEALPDALAPYALSVRDPTAPLDGGNALALHLSTGSGQHASITVEALTADASPEALARLRKAVRLHVDVLLPFVDRHLVAVGSPHDGLPIEGPSIDGSDGAKPIPKAALDAVWDLPEPRELGFCGLPHATGIKQLYLASRQTLPGLGLEGELAAGWIAARLITTRAKRKEVDKTDLLVGS